jgi:hypothetical protein
MAVTGANALPQDVAGVNNDALWLDLDTRSTPSVGVRTGCES